MVVPELQRRGLYRTAYEGNTLARESRHSLCRLRKGGASTGADEPADKMRARVRDC